MSNKLDEANHHIWRVIYDPDPCGLVGLTIDNIHVGFMLKFGSFTERSRVKHRIYGIFTAWYDLEPKKPHSNLKYQRMVLRNGTWEARVNKHMGLTIARIGETNK